MTFSEMLQPAYWRYRKATRILMHARWDIGRQIPTNHRALVVLLEAHWQVEDEYYGRSDRVMGKLVRHPYFWEVL